jgi:hypothetical protein
MKTITIALIAATIITAQSPFGLLTTSNPPDPATEVADQIARLTKLLTLTAAQVTQATVIYTNALTAVTPLEATLNTDYTTLDAAVKSNSTGTVDSLSASIGTLTGQVIDIRNKADAAFYAILTTGQQTILNSRGGFDGPGGPAGPGGQGPRH